MLENKLVDGAGQEPRYAGDRKTADSTLWDLRMHMLEDGNGLENVAYPGHYLMVALLGNRTVLFGHDIRTAPTRSYVESLLSIGEEEMSGSGSGMDESEMSSAEVPTDTASTEEVEGEVKFVVMSSWQLETLGAPRVRFQTTSETHDCFLAIDANGQPETNLCEVPEGENVLLNFVPYFS